MKNETSLIRQNRTLAENRKGVFYHTSLRDVTGSVNSAILMHQFEYWFEKPNFRFGFFKFMAPCDKPQYKKGDSWTEELNFTVDEFQSAISKICQPYKSINDIKRAYASKDIFKGKFYASYRDRINHLTFYIRNDELVNKVLFELFNPEEISQNSCRREFPVYVEGEDNPVEGNSPFTYKGISLLDSQEITPEIKKEKIYKKEKSPSSIGCVVADAPRVISKNDLGIKKEKKGKDIFVSPEADEHWDKKEIRKEKKKSAFDELEKAVVKKKIPLATILSARTKYLDQCTQEGKEKKYIQTFYHWLKEERWTDELEEKKSSPVSKISFEEVLEGFDPELMSFGWDLLKNGRIDSNTFKSWIYPLTYIQTENNKIFVKAPTKFIKSHITSNPMLSGAIKISLRAAFPNVNDFVIVV